MNMNFIRFVDFWIGIPLCFILSSFHSVGKIFGLHKRAYRGKPQKILFIEISEMGTAIVAHSSLAEAKKQYPRAQLYFLIFEELKESVALLDIIPQENILTIRGNSFFRLALDTFLLIWRCRREHIDTVIDLEFFARYSAIISYLSGAQRRVGFFRFYTEGLYRGNFLTHKVVYNPYVHTAQTYLSLVHALEAPRDDLPLNKVPVVSLDTIVAQHPKIQSTPSQKQVIWRKLKTLNQHITEKNRIVLINPNSSQLIPLRRWPLERFAVLAKKILGDHQDTYLLITGVASERQNAQDICSFVKSERCIDFTGQVTLRELIDLYNISTALITNDSGPVHFASLTNIKIIVFFGPETPVKYTPLTKNHEIFYSHFACSPCVSAFNGLHSPCNNNLCLQVMGIEEVYRRFEKSLSQ